MSAHCHQAKRTHCPSHACILNITVWLKLRIITCTKAHALSAQIQSDTQWYPGLHKLIQLCSILDRMMLTFSHHAMQKWASPSVSLVALLTVNPPQWYSGKAPVSDYQTSTQPYIFKVEYYTDIDCDGHEISRFGGLPRELYFPKGLYFPEVRSTEGNIVPRENITILAPPTRDISSVPVDICYIRRSKWMISSKFYVLYDYHEVW